MNSMRPCCLSSSAIIIMKYAQSVSSLLFCSPMPSLQQRPDVYGCIRGTDIHSQSQWMIAWKVKSGFCSRCVTYKHRENGGGEHMLITFELQKTLELCHYNEHFTSTLNNDFFICFSRICMHRRRKKESKRTNRLATNRPRERYTYFSWQRP